MSPRMSRVVPPPASRQGPRRHLDPCLAAARARLDAGVALPRRSRRPSRPVVAPESAGRRVLVPPTTPPPLAGPCPACHRPLSAGCELIAPSPVAPNGLHVTMLSRAACVGEPVGACLILLGEPRP